MGHIARGGHDSLTNGTRITKIPAASLIVDIGMQPPVDSWASGT